MGQLYLERLGKFHKMLALSWHSVFFALPARRRSCGAIQNRKGMSKSNYINEQMTNKQNLNRLKTSRHS